MKTEHISIAFCEADLARVFQAADQGEPIGTATILAVVLEMVLNTLPPDVADQFVEQATDQIPAIAKSVRANIVRRTAN